MNALTKADAVRLPALEVQTNPQVGSLYLWEDFTDAHHTFFVRPVTVGESTCLVDVFGIHDGSVKPLGRERFIRQGDGLFRCFVE